MKPNFIKVQSLVFAPIQTVWEQWTNPSAITQWYVASEGWHTPYAENNPIEEGKFLFRMAEMQGEISFDFTGTYTKVIPQQQLHYVTDDGRKVEISFKSQGQMTLVTEHFEPEKVHPEKFQQQGWQNILDSFKRFVESSGGVTSPKQTIPQHSA